MTARLDADTIRHARKHLANHGRRTDGHYWTVRPGFDELTAAVKHLGIGIDLHGPACVIGAMALSLGGPEHLNAATDCLVRTWAAWLIAYPQHDGATSVVAWNDQVATDADVDEFLAWWQDQLEQADQ